MGSILIINATFLRNLKITDLVEIGKSLIEEVKASKITL